jgi:hypothetical protein
MQHKAELMRTMLHSFAGFYYSPVRVVFTSLSVSGHTDSMVADQSSYQTCQIAMAFTQFPFLDQQSQKVRPVIMK